MTMEGIVWFVSRPGCLVTPFVIPEAEWSEAIWNPASSLWNRTAAYGIVSYQWRWTMPRTQRKPKPKPKVQFKTEVQAEHYVKAAQEAEVDENAESASRRIVAPRRPPTRRAKNDR
jgi:hypothetical protein